MGEPCVCRIIRKDLAPTFRIDWCDLHARAEQTAAERDRYKRERNALLEAARFLMLFIPDWAKHVPEGLDPTMYGTGTQLGDVRVMQSVMKTRALLAACEEEKDVSEG